METFLFGLLRYAARQLYIRGFTARYLREQIELGSVISSIEDYAQYESALQQRRAALQED